MYITGTIINKDIKIKPFCIILVPQLLKYLVFLTKKWYKYILVIPDIILNCLILFIGLINMYLILPITIETLMWTSLFVI